MIGVDITFTKRFENKSDRFVKKILSSEEFLEWQNSKNKELFLAQRWAIKESLFKANNDLHDYSKINIIRNKNGSFHYDGFEITTSKENDYVIAFVLRSKNE